MLPLPTLLPLLLLLPTPYPAPSCPDLGSYPQALLVRTRLRIRYFHVIEKESRVEMSYNR